MNNQHHNRLVIDKDVDLMMQGVFHTCLLDFLGGAPAPAYAIYNNNTLE